MERYIERYFTGDNSYDYIKKSFELKNLKLYKEAIEMLYKALGCEDISDKKTEVISQIGDLYFLLKNYERAIDQYEKALDTDPLHAHSLFQLCEIYFLQNDYERALSLIKELCENSKELKNYVNYFKILLKLGRHVQMLELYSGLENELKRSDEILYMLAAADEKNKENYLKEVIEVNPKHTSALLDLGVIYYNNGNLKDAYDCFKSALECREDSACAYYYLGLISQQHGEFTKAIEQFLRAIKMESNTNLERGRYYFDLAKSYTDVAWYDEAHTAALESLRLLREKNPETNFDEHYFLITWINIQQKDYSSALLNLDFISNTSTVGSEAQVLRYVISLENGDYAEAKAGLEAYCAKNEQNKNNPIFLSALGRVYKELKMYDEAVALYGRAVEAYPDSFEYMDELINMLVDAEDYDKALTLAQDFKKANPRNTGVYNTLARVYYRLDKKEEALKNLQKLLKLEANVPEARYFAGLILNDLNKPKKALENLSAALELDPGVPKYYAQLSRSYALLKNYKDALLFIKEAIGLAPHEIAYLKAAQEISDKMDDKSAQKFFASQVRRLEKMLKER